MPKVEIFSSSVAGSVKVNKETDLIKMMLSAAKIPFTEVDLALDENEDKKQLLREKSGTRVIPKVFVDNEYKGDFAAIELANEDGLLRQQLGLE